MIKMVISPEYFGSNDKKSDIVSQLKNLGAYDINIDEGSGFVTAIMTMDNYEGFVDTLKKRIEQNAEEVMLKYKGIHEISYNPDYTVFKIKGGRLSKTERKAAAFELLMSSAAYQVISGIPQSDASIRVYFYDKDGNETDCIDIGESEFV